ncbi:hypothetical protein JJC03_10755 [Flavobacterium oreochromis]|uniref:hypothetical protein n=1 Tax=Flavobacterium oreochromis TaxID=2906078 RepID=UPI001CE60510|nr:hypothetical protein [Flavobacterium oreochromis]QYS85660.1 hypothetical protein JJC03_10755 [Flavobacterium oreochromis]
MKKHDNLFEQFKKASKVQEAHDFPGMEKVWSRVDAKLDTEIFNTQQKTNLNWKKYTVAATVFIGTIFTFQLIQQSNFNHSIANTIVKVTKEKLNKSLLTDTTPVVLNKAPLIKKKEIKKSFFNNYKVLLLLPLTINQSYRLTLLLPKWLP